MSKNRKKTSFLDSYLPMVVAAASVGAMFSLFLDMSETSGYLTQVFAAVSGMGIALAGAALVLINLQRHRRKHRKRVFISYAHEDQDFALKLSDSLRRIGAVPLIDHHEVVVGDDIAKAVDKLIDVSDFTVFIASPQSLKSNWAQKELTRALENDSKLLPVVLDAEAIPSSIANIVYADFTKDYESGLGALKRALSLQENEKEQEGEPTS